MCLTDISNATHIYFSVIFNKSIQLWKMPVRVYKSPMWSLKMFCIVWPTVQNLEIFNSIQCYKQKKLPILALEKLEPENVSHFYWNGWIFSGWTNQSLTLSLSVCVCVSWYNVTQFNYKLNILDFMNAWLIKLILSREQGVLPQAQRCLHCVCSVICSSSD